MILYTIPPDAPWYFHPPIKASGAKGARKKKLPELLARQNNKDKASYAQWRVRRAQRLSREAPLLVRGEMEDRIEWHDAFVLQPYSFNRARIHFSFTHTLITYYITLRLLTHPSLHLMNSRPVWELRGKDTEGIVTQDF